MPNTLLHTIKFDIMVKLVLLSKGKLMQALLISASSAGNKM